LKKKIAIIGAGWFGCHIANEIIKFGGFDLKIFERQKEIFLGASSNNQNRLHLGFHYPRSKITRVQSKIGFKKFLKIYPFLCEKINPNIYSVANNSETQIDFGTFIQVMKSEGLSFKKIDIEKKYKILGMSGSILTDEMLINPFKSKKFFEKKLSKFLYLNQNISKIKKIDNKYKINNELFDYVINSTYYQSFIEVGKKIFYEVTASIIYKNIKKFPALTVMDGPFFTIYPYKKNYYNVYSVTHSRFSLSKNINKCEVALSKVRKNKKILESKRNLIEKKILNYYPNFKKEFKFQKYLTCIRTINNSKYADRSFKIYFNEGLINIYSGKIDHITSASEEIIKYLKKNN
jgi:hypothetical protein